MNHWRNNRGSSLVEFAIVCLLLFTVVFGIIEFGMLMKNYLTLNQAVREGARSAALGSPMAVITDRVQNSAPGIPDSDEIANIELYKKTPTSTDWALIATNDATPGDQVRVRAEYPHKLITGNFFGWLGTDGTVTISADMVMRRE